MKNFKDKVVVVLGAASGIGRSSAIAFAKEGAKLHISDIREKEIMKVAEEIKAMGGKATAYHVDSTSRDGVKNFADAVFKAEGRVDVLHNNAGMSYGCPVEELSLEDWEKIINLNLWGVIHGVHFFLPGMIKQGGESHIVNTASAAGLTAAPSLSAYCTTKYAVVGLSEVMNIELPRYGIHTTALCPGIINTGLVAETRITLKDSKGREIKDRLVEFYKKKGVSPDVVAKDVLKAVRKKIPIKASPNSHVYPLWIMRRISVRLFQFMMRKGSKKFGFHVSLLLPLLSLLMQI